MEEKRVDPRVLASVEAGFLLPGVGIDVENLRMVAHPVERATKPVGGPGLTKTVHQNGVDAGLPCPFPQLLEELS